MLNQLEKMRIAPVYASATTASHFSVPSAAPCQRVGCFSLGKERHPTNRGDELFGLRRQRSPDWKGGGLLAIRRGKQGRGAEGGREQY